MFSFCLVSFVFLNWSFIYFCRPRRGVCFICPSYGIFLSICSPGLNPSSETHPVSAKFLWQNINWNFYGKHFHGKKFIWQKLNLVLEENTGHSCQTKIFEGSSMGSPSSFKCVKQTLFSTIFLGKQIFTKPQYDSCWSTICSVLVLYTDDSYQQFYIHCDRQWH